MSRIPRSFLRAAALALALLCVSAPVRGDYRESYRKGIEAADRRQWSEVARWMRQALAEEPQEGEPVKIYGVRFEPYLPHYYLGMALYQADDCEGALAQWQESERQGEVQRTSRFKTLTQNRDTCRQRLAAKTPSPPPAPAGPDPSAVAQAANEAEAEVQRAAAVQAQLARRRGDPDYAEAWRQEGAQQSEAQTAELLGSARSRLEKAKGQKQVSEIQEAGRLAARARQDFDALLGRVDRRQGQILQAQREQKDREEADRLAREQREVEERRQQEEAVRLARESQERAQRQELARQVERAAADAKEILDRSAGTSAPGADLQQRRRTALRDLLRRAGSSVDATPLAELERLRDGLSSAAASLEEALLRAEGNSGPPAELRAAARAFFRADYEEVIRRLGRATFQDRRATLTSQLLLAAARYSLWVLGGGKDGKLREQALESVRACRRIDPRLVPDAKMFSPRFAEFFKAGR